MGAALYDHYGYFVPFVAASLAVMVPIVRLEGMSLFSFHYRSEKHSKYII